MRRSLHWLLSLVALVVLAGCVSAPETRADYESIVTRQHNASSRRELEARGYRYSEVAPDLLVNFNTSVTQQPHVHPGPMPFYPGYYGFWGGYYEPCVDQYDEGALNIDVVDARRKQLVWEGTTVGRISDKAKNNRSAALDLAVRDMFTQLPFHAGDAAGN